MTFRQFRRRAVRAVDHARRDLVRQGLKTIRRLRARAERRLRNVMGPARGMHLKEPGVPYGQSFQGWTGQVRLRYVEHRAQRRKRLLLRRYRRLSSPVDLSAPFIYLPLHFQPERTTSSLGGAFCNQLLIADLLARTMPEGWRVYVKEHPSQFYPKFAGERARFPDYYAAMAAIPGVQLVPLTVSPFDLIDAARCVATVTGTSGWEALSRGTPVLLFGFGAWYKGVEGTLHVTSEAECRLAFERLQAGYRVEGEPLRRFMLAVDRASVRANMGYGTPDEVASGIDHAASVDALTLALKRWDGTSQALRRSPATL